MRDQEFAAVQALPGPDRYSYFVRRVADREELWTLRNEEGFVLYANDDGQEVVPIICQFLGTSESEDQEPQPGS